MVTYSRRLGRIRHLVWGAVALLILLGFLLQNAAESAFMCAWVIWILILNSHSLNTFVVDIVQRGQGGEKQKWK